MLRKLLVATAALVLTASAAQASLIDQGITYTLTETTTGNPLTDQFTLGIAGINSTAPVGRYGVQSFAFTQPTNYLTATPPAGFSLIDGGLNANGCDSKGTFFCFSTTAPTGPALPANSTLSYTFDITLSSGTFANYVPDFKINWVGTQNNYSLVSAPLGPTSGTVPEVPVPEPGSLLLLGTGLLGLGVIMRQRRKG